MEVIRASSNRAVDTCLTRPRHGTASRGAGRANGILFRYPRRCLGFAAAATVPFIKGFLSLDFRVAQRTLNNRPQITIEVSPQAIALASTIPLC